MRFPGSFSISENGSKFWILLPPKWKRCALLMHHTRRLLRTSSGNELARMLMHAAVIG